MVDPVAGRRQGYRVWAADQESSEHGFNVAASASAWAAMNQVVSNRFVKRQLMRWTERGAHLLLQTRTKDLSVELRPTFDRWYPGMKEAA